jgi:GR25 family glycosyltransferase involved in LPS biosynthesis
MTNTKICTSNYRTFFENKIIDYIPHPYFYSNEEIKEKKIRYCEKWHFKHLKTGYGILFKSIPKSYLQKDNVWLSRCTDCAEMYSVSELSNGKISQISEPLYVYNKDNSILYDTSYYVNQTEHSTILKFLKSLPVCNYTWPYTYIINMPKDVDKKNKMIHQLTYMQNSNYEFIEAIDGELSNSTIYENYLQNFKEYLKNIPKTKLNYNVSKQHITKKSFGLLQSVFSVLQKFVQQDINHIVLFEDDVYSHKEINYYFLLNDKVLKNKDIVYLGCHHNKNKIYHETNDKDVFINVQQLPYLIYGTYSIIISKNIAQFILSFGLENIVKLNLSWDLFLNYVREKYEYTFYLYFKQLFIPDVFHDGINGIRTMSFYHERDIEINEYHFSPSN